MRIWTGRAGSGKTTAILREIAALSERGEGRQILLVPELNSHLMERRLAAATHNHGARTAEVLTFSRLADRVFSEVGGLAQQMLTPAGQLLTLQEAARRVQGGLSAWKGLADKPELLQEALRLIDAVSEEPYSETTVAAAHRMGSYSRAAVVGVLLSQVALNLLQLALGGAVHASSYTVALPLTAILLMLSAMLLARFMERGKRIKEDNDSII